MTTAIMVSTCFGTGADPFQHAVHARHGRRLHRGDVHLEIARRQQVQRHPHARRLHELAAPPERRLHVRSRVVDRRRVHSESSAADITCAWMPPTSRHTDASVDPTLGQQVMPLHAGTPRPVRRVMRLHALARPATACPLDLPVAFDRGRHDVVHAIGERLGVVHRRLVDRAAAESDRGRRASRSPGSVRSRPFGITPRVPMTASGTIGSPA